MRSAAARASAMVRTRSARGTRRPAASTRSFISCLSRNPRTVSTVMPGTPNRSRSRAAVITMTSQLASTRSTSRPRIQSDTRATTSSSSRRRGTCR